MPSPAAAICFEASVERIAASLPRYIVYPGEAWDESETFAIDVHLNGVSIGLRNLIPWKGRGWHFGLSEPICRKAGIGTGDRVQVEMRRPLDARAPELIELLRTKPKAAAAWKSLTTAQQRDFNLWVAGAKQSATRTRRAARLLRTSGKP